MIFWFICFFSSLVFEFFIKGFSCSHNLTRSLSILEIFFGFFGIFSFFVVDVLDFFGLKRMGEKLSGWLLLFFSANK